MKMIITEEKSNDMLNKLHNVVETIKDIAECIEHCEEDKDFREDKYRNEYKYRRDRDYDEDEREPRRKSKWSRY